MQKIVNRYQLTCELRTQIKILEFKTRHRRQLLSFYCTGILALLMILSRYYRLVLLVLVGAFLVFGVWMLWQLLSIKNEYIKYKEYYPDKALTVELGDVIKVTDENGQIETYKYDSVCAIGENKKLVLLVTHTTSIALIKPILDEENNEIVHIRKKIRR